MTFQLTNTLSVISLMKQQIMQTNAVETDLWDQMTTEVTDLMDRMSSVTCAILTENAGIEKEIILAEQNQKLHTALDTSRITLLSRQIEVIEKEVEHLEQRIKQIKVELGLSVFGPQSSPTLSKYLESIDVVRGCFVKHRHALAYGMQNDHAPFLTTEPKI